MRRTTNVATAFELLMAAGEEMRQTQEQLRGTAESIAGVEMTDWTAEEVERYMDMLLRKWNRMCAARLGTEF